MAFSDSCAIWLWSFSCMEPDIPLNSVNSDCACLALRPSLCAVPLNHSTMAGSPPSGALSPYSLGSAGRPSLE